MPQWIFVATAYSDYNAGKIEIMMRNMFVEKTWKIGKRTPYRTHIKKEDKVLFYETGENKKQFVASAVLNSKYIPDDELCGHVLLKNISIFKNPIKIKPLLKNFKSIKKKKYWGLFFQGGIAKITEKEYQLIISKYRKIDHLKENYFNVIFK